MNKYLTFAVLATMLASCANNDEPAVVTEDNAPITVTAGVNELEARAGHDSSNLPAKFYLSITQDATDTDSKYNYSDVEMTKGTDNTYTPAKTLLWADNGNHSSATIYAYTTNAETFTVQTDQSTEDGSGVKNSDLLGAASSNTDDVTITNDNIAIAFRHLLCKLDVTFEWGDEYASASKSITKVTYSGFGTDCKLNRTEGTITNGTTTDKITAYLTTTETGYFSEAIFAPQVDTPKIIITTMIDSVERTFILNVTAPNGGFASGSCYSTTVTIGGEVPTVSPTISKGWETGTNGNIETE